jgi:hypothetical protein
MIGKQKQLEEGNTGTLSVKLHKWAIQLLDIIAESREHGTNANDLLKKCIEFVIETAKITGPVPPEMKTLIDMLKLDAAWHSAFNFGDVTATNDIAQIILVLQQHDGKEPRQGFGLAMINKPFMGDATITYCVDSILERIVNISMKGLYQDLRDIGNALGTQSMRETLTMLCDAQKLAELDNSLRDELPQMGNFSDFGKAIEWGQRTKQKKHRTPDSLANSQQRIVFDDYDREVADYEANDWEGEHRQTEEPPTNMSDHD